MSDSINMTKPAFFKLVSTRKPCAIAVVHDKQPFKAPVAHINLISEGAYVTVRTVRGPGVYRTGKPIEMRERTFKQRIAAERTKFERWLSEYREEQVYGS